MGQTIIYTYDDAGRRTKATEPEGNYVQYTYDDRGNITQTQRFPKPGYPQIPLVTSASYPESCSNPVTCNEPTSTTDALGNETDYTYDPTHGGVSTVTAPAASPGGARLTTSYTYAQFQAHYLLAGPQWTDGDPVWRLTQVSRCATASTCSGTHNETVTTIAYAGTPNNVLPSSITTRAGDSSVTATTSMTYTNWGDVATVQGPLGALDATRYYYDDGRRLIGTVGPDPDGNGAYRAVKTSYNAIGEPTVVERGTVPSQGDTALSSLTSLEKQDTVYDAYGRPIESRLWNGGSIAALTQYNYDSRDRPLCTAVRMNAAAFGSPPEACTLGSAGPDGEDRISRTVYDAAGHVVAKQSAYGTALQQTTAAYTYTNNGKVETQTDARGYLTRYEYDGFDRLLKHDYPDPGTPNQSSTSDYEQITYAGNGEIEHERLRNGDLVTFGYDDLGRVTSRMAGQEAGASYTYDLFGRMTTASQSGETITDTYDALSRLTNEESAVSGQFDETVSYHYDAAGHRTRMDYPGGFYVTYAYDNAGDLTDLYENGSTRLAKYSYDGLGRRTQLERLPNAGQPGAVTSYQYDAISRLASLTQDVNGTSDDTSVSFGYNAASQAVSRTDTNPVYDLPVATATTESYAADGLNRYTSALGTTPTYDALGNLTSDGTKTYGYDDDNRLTSVSGGVSLGYDPAGRLQKVVGASTTRFLYDGSEVIAEYDGSNAVLRRYVYGPGVDEPLVWYEGSGTSNRKWLLADERGSVIGITNDAGNVTQVNKYDAYGEPDAGNEGRFQYTGQMWITELGLYDYKARDYNPRLGRFMQTDPIGSAGGMNLYGYAGNDPVNMTDSTGLCTWGVNNSWQSWDELTQTLTAHSNFECLFDVPVPYLGASSSAAAPTVGSGPSRTVRCGSGMASACHEAWQPPPPINIDWNTLGIVVTSIGDLVPGADLISPEVEAGLITERAARTLKAVNLPAWRKVGIDLAHVLERHTVGGTLSAGRTTFPELMNEKGIERAIRQAYRYGDKLSSQGDRVLIRGTSNGLTIEMWVNRTTGMIETAYPVIP